MPVGHDREQGGPLVRSADLELAADLGECADLPGGVPEKQVERITVDDVGERLEPKIAPGIADLAVPQLQAALGVERPQPGIR